MDTLIIVTDGSIKVAYCIFLCGISFGDIQKWVEMSLICRQV